MRRTVSAGFPPRTRCRSQGAAVSLNPADTPDLIDEEPPTSNSIGHTLFLKIDLEIDPMGGKLVEPMTAVFAPDPKRLTGGNVDLLLWFHGDKRVWSKNRKGTLDMSGKSIRDYLKTDE